MASETVRRFTGRALATLVIVTFHFSPSIAQQPQPPATGPNASATSDAGTSSSQHSTKSAGAKERIPESVFQKLDKNHDKVLTEPELNTPEAAPYASRIWDADRDGNKRITLEEFNRLDETPIYRDPRTAAVLLLIIGFGAFCLFLDGLFDPEHRDYFLWSAVGALVCVALSFVLGRAWFLEQPPYIAYVAVVPAVVILVAVVAGATREQEAPPAAPTGPVVYQVGKPTGPTAKPGAGGQPPRRTPPPRTPRPPPMARPPVPERRPPSTGQPPPRPTPPRPPGSRPPGNPKPPPGKP